MATLVADATTTVVVTATLATTVTVASAAAIVAVTVAEVTAATTGLLAVPLPRGAATALSLLAAHLRLPATTMTAAATTRSCRRVDAYGVTATGY